MTAIATRPSVLAIVAESTEGTAVAPGATTDFIALQDGFTMVPNFATQKNAELRASIGEAKPILGAESPTASLSHYLRHSGVEGQAPDYRLMLLTALGTEVVAGTEYATGSSSTVILLKATSASTHFQRGQIVLIKDGTNGYSIRAVHSTTSTDVVLGFNLANAPGSGVNLGKCVLYKPLETGHPTNSLWYYVGNAGAIELMTGMRVTSVDLDFTAGNLINVSYQMEGLGFYFDPIIITASTKYIDWTDDSGTFAATVATGVYKDPHDLAAALKLAMDTANAAKVHTVTYSNTTGQFTILCAGTVLSLLWNSGTNTANSIATKMGFSTAADLTGTTATTGYTGSAMSFVAGYTPALDAADPLIAKYHELMIGDSTDYAVFNASTMKVSIKLTRKPIESVCAQTGILSSVVTARAVTASFTALLDKFNADKFRRFRSGADTRAQYSFGTKTGGNWNAGSCGAVYLPTTTVTKFNVNSKDGLATVDGEVTAYVDSSSNAEVYLGFV